MKIIDLRNIINGDFSKVKKDVGLLLVDTGFMNYKKLTEKNYNYWWYEVQDKSEIDKKKFTYDWNDLIPARKFEILKEFIQYHKDTESIYGIINNALQIIACGNEVDIPTKEKMNDKVFKMLYGAKIKNQQLTLWGNR